MANLKLIFLASAALIGLANAGSNGAYPGACRFSEKLPLLSINMIPSHPKEAVILERDDPKATMDIVREDEVLNITISSDEPFKGFLIVVQDGDETKGAKIRGKFLPYGLDQKGLICDGDDTGLTHTENSEKTSVTGIWEIPEDLGQDFVIVRATVMYEKLAGDHIREKFDLK